MQKLNFKNFQKGVDRDTFDHLRKKHSERDAQETTLTKAHVEGFITVY